MFTDDELQKLRKHVSHYPQPRAGAIYCLYAVQDKVGYINDEGLQIVSELTKLSCTQLEELISFFTLLYRRPIGKNVLRICDSISCYVMGSRKILNTAISHSKKINDEVTVLPSICLGLCDKAPAALLNGREVIHQLNQAKIIDILDSLVNQQAKCSAKIIATSRGMMDNNG